MTIVQRRGDWLSAMVGDELVMMSVENGNYLGISPIGARIWELIEQPRSLDELCGKLVDEYEVAPDACRADVLRFVEEMREHGAVAVEPAPGS